MLRSKWLAAMLTAGLMLPALADDDENEGLEHLQLPQVSNKNWKAECASCHMAYPPGLLPARSWQKMMQGLDKHFGQNAELDAPTAADIGQFLQATAADSKGRYRVAEIAAAIPAGSTPLRISETRYFRELHHELRTDVFRRKSIGSAGNCVACHRGAEAGNFDEHQVRIPR